MADSREFPGISEREFPAALLDRDEDAAGRGTMADPIDSPVARAGLRYCGALST